jgi:hypothetical protein
MDILLSFLFLLIASVVGITVCLFLGMKSYLKIALLVICIFIPMELFYDYFYNTKNKTNTTYPNITQNPQNSIQHSNSKLNTIPDTTKYAKVDSGTFEIDKPPFDGLDPKELLNRLNYIYYATSNPQKPIHYLEYKIHADKLLESGGNDSNNCNSNTNTNTNTKGGNNGNNGDNGSNDNYMLTTHDEKLLQYSNAFYPQLNKNQIDTSDCLNYGSGKGSCFQNPSLFFNVKNDFNILTKGVSEDNANLIVREDFKNYNMTSANASVGTNNNNNNNNDIYSPILFANAPMGNLDIPLDQESNETINLDNSGSQCRNCKLALCKDDYCSLQNQLFM